MHKIVILFFLYYAHLAMGDTAEEMLEKMKYIHENCVENSGVSEELIDAVNEDKIFADHKTLKCYMQCTMEKLGYMNEEGEVDVEAAIQIVPEDIRHVVEPTIRSCGTKRGADPCENAWLTQKCYSEHPKYQLL